MCTLHRTVSRVFDVFIVSCRRVNPVERMYAAWPAFLYLNASLCAPMLVPLLESQDARVGQLYASPDLGMWSPKSIYLRPPGLHFIGTLYPIATGGVGLPSEGVEGHPLVSLRLGNRSAHARPFRICQYAYHDACTRASHRGWVAARPARMWISIILHRLPNALSLS